jgi:putative endopeptidase
MRAHKLAPESVAGSLFLKFAALLIRVVLCLFVLLLAACGRPPEDPQPLSGSSVAGAAIGAWGVDLDNRDAAVRAGDDFFRHASGTWLDEYTLPADKTGFGSFNALHDRSQERVRDLVDNLASREPDFGTIGQKIGDYYRSYLDVAALNHLGYAPIQDELGAILAIRSLADLARAFGRSDFEASSSPIALGIEIDRMDPDRFIAGISLAGLGLPDRDYYLEQTDRFAGIREEYLAHIGRLLEIVGYEDTRSAAGAVLALETSIAEHQWPRADRRNRDLTYNLMDVSAIEAAFPDFPWADFLLASGLAAAELNVHHPSAMEPLVEIIRNTDLATWRAYLTYHLVSNNARFLAEDIDNANFDFYGRALRGQLEQRERWRRAISLVGGSQSLGDAIGQIYVDRYFPPASKLMMEDLVENLRAALQSRIEQLPWMGEETREYALAKLAAFTPKIGYPKTWRDFSTVAISADNLMGNVKELRQFFQEEAISRLHRPTDRDEWFATPQTVNAFYNPQFNAITFPAGILEPPFFDPSADAAVNYGAIGAVIGHEMGHGFDDQGSKSDARGVQRNWWTPEDRARFDARAAMLAEQYSQYEPVPGTHVDGRFTLGENIGDLGGLNVAYHAYRLSLGGAEAPVIDGLTGDQRFFLAYAQVWRSKTREEALVSRLKSDPHSPAAFRVNGVVRNVDAWYDAFDVAPEDALYLAPEDRVSIW